MLDYQRDTITAVATPVGSGGIGMVRISGPDSLNTLHKVFNPVLNECPYESHRLYLGDIVDLNGDKIDRVLATYMKAPRTYTGEDVVEITCHGGSVVAEVIKDCLLEFGLREALPGEFTKRAFYEGKIDLTEAEAINELSLTTTRFGASIASGVLRGGLKERYNDLKTDLLKIGAKVSALIDFEEDVSEAIDEKDIANEISRVIEELSSLKKSYRNYLVLSRGMRVVIVGKKNAGKTTLFNRLLGEQRGIVSDLPGTTRDWLEGLFELEGYSIRLIDTAGLGDAEDYLDFLGMEKTSEMIDGADLLLLIIDGTRGFDEEDERIVELLEGKRFITLINKTDKMEEDIINNIYNNISYISDIIISLSSLKGDNLNDLLSFLQTELQTYHRSNTYLISKRQYTLTSNMLSHLKLSGKYLDDGIGLEEIAEHISSATTFLEEITGDSISERIIDEIFENFCVGK